MTQIVYHSDPGESPSEAVLAAIKETGACLTGASPLNEAIDPTALNNLFDDRPPGTVGFQYLDFEIVVSSEGHVDVENVNHPNG